jgi:hypothetical protein
MLLIISARSLGFIQGPQHLCRTAFRHRTRFKKIELHKLIVRKALQWEQLFLFQGSLTC